MEKVGIDLLRVKQRSIVFDLFGDYIRYSGGRVKLAELTELMAVFGFEPPTVRVVMSRLKKEGWFDTIRDGRETIYTLNERSYQLLDEGRERIFNRKETSWAGRWTMVIYQVPEADRATRERLRKRLSWLGFGQLTSSTWVAPHDLFSEAERLAASESTATVDVLWCETGGLESDRELVTRCWELGPLSEDYQRFIATYKSLDDPTISKKDGRQALRARMAIISAFRRFPFRDPSLPLELQPAGWPGWEAYELFARVHAQLGEQANAYVAEVVGQPVMSQA